MSKHRWQRRKARWEKKQAKKQRKLEQHKQSGQVYIHSDKQCKQTKRFNQNRHHDFAKSRGGSWENSNIIWLNVDFHNWIHKRFGNKTLKEIIEILTRLDRAKKNQSNGDSLACKYSERFTKRGEEMYIRYDCHDCGEPYCYEPYLKIEIKCKDCLGFGGKGPEQCQVVLINRFRHERPCVDCETKSTQKISAI